MLSLSNKQIMEARVTVIILAVTDVKRSTQFYKDLGFPLESEGEVSSFFNLSGIKFSVLDRSYLEQDANISLNQSGFSPFNLTHMVRTKDEVDLVLNAAERLGAKVVRAPMLAEWGAYSAFFADFDNHLWEIVYHQDWIPPVIQESQGKSIKE